MAIYESLREALPDGAVLFNNPYFDRSIVGTTFDGRVIYDYDLMVAELMTDEGMSEESACDFISYNTLRALPYMGEKQPLVVSKVDF